MVKDVEHWLSSPKREELIGPLGITNIRKLVDPENPNHVALLVEVPDMDTVKRMMESPEAAEGHGVRRCDPRDGLFLVERD